MHTESELSVLTQLGVTQITSMARCMPRLYGMSSAILHIDVVCADSQAIITLQKVNKRA